MTKADELKRVQVHSCWCPNCGIPRNVPIPLKTYLRKKKDVPFSCPSCGLRIHFVVQNGKGRNKKEPEESKMPNMKDVMGVVKTAKVLKGLV